MAPHSLVAPLRSAYLDLNISGLRPEATRASISAVVGQMSLRKTGWPSLPVARGSVGLFVCVAAAWAAGGAKGTTRGGDMRKLDFTAPWTRASKLRLPERTEAVTRLPSLMAFSM